MLFCLKENIPQHLSLCHYVLKRISVSFCHYVILSSKKHLSLTVTMLFCLKENICLHLSLCYYVFKINPIC